MKITLVNYRFYEVNRLKPLFSCNFAPCRDFTYIFPFVQKNAVTVIFTFQRPSQPTVTA